MSSMPPICAVCSQPKDDVRHVNATVGGAHGYIPADMTWTEPPPRPVEVQERHTALAKATLLKMRRSSVLDMANTLALAFAAFEQEVREEAAQVAEKPTGYFQIGIRQQPYWDGVKIAAALRGTPGGEREGE